MEVNECIRKQPSYMRISPSYVAYFAALSFKIIIIHSKVQFVGLLFSNILGRSE